MLDLKKIVNNKIQVEEALSKRMGNISLDNIIVLDEKRRCYIFELQKLQQIRNKVSKEISILKHNGSDTSELILQMKNIRVHI